MHRIILMLTVATLVTQHREAEATLLGNGNLETWSSATNAGTWTENGTFNRNDGVNSPFTDVIPTGSTSATMNGTGNKFIYQLISPQTGVVQNVMEFKFDTLPTNSNVYHWSQDNNAGDTIFRFSLGANFGKYTANTTDIEDILSLTAGTWYQVVVDVDLPNEMVSGGIRPFGGSFTLFSEPFSESTSSIVRVLGPTSGFLTDTNPNQPIVFDNLYLGPAIFSFPTAQDTLAVPEPGTLSLLGLGGVLLVRGRRTRKG